MVLRMEDLDTQRCSDEYADVLRQDLTWLGLDWDLETQPQSQRSDIYARYFAQLRDMGLLYPCYCTRSQLHRIDAPHLSDGTYVYPGTCRDLTPEQRSAFGREPSWRIRVPDKSWTVEDLLQGTYRENLVTDCGDFVLRRADGVFVYQLAVTVDDAEAGVTQVVRGVDLLSSAPRQMYLQSLLGFHTPVYGHIPLLVSPDGRRLSKRDQATDLGYLRQHATPEKILGTLAHAAGLLPEYQPVSAKELIDLFSWDKLCPETIRIDPAFLL